MTRIPSLRIPLVLLAGAAGGALMAAETDFNDFRVSGGILPGIQSETSSGTTMDTSAKVGGGAQIDYQHLGYVNDGPWAWLAGAGVFGDFQKGTISGTDLKSNAYGGMVDIGVGYRFANAFHLELAPFFGLGEDNLKVDSVKGHGTFLKYGATLAAFWQFQPHWQVGIDGGWEGFRGKAKADFAHVGSDQDVTYKGKSGAVAGLTIGYRL